VKHVGGGEPAMASQRRGGARGSWSGGELRRRSLR
jgi:hypothetical protein